MSDKPTMLGKGIRGLIAALDAEKPHPSMVELYQLHGDYILTNKEGVPVMPIYRIVEVVLAAALPEGDLFIWCPDCDGVGEIETMAHDPTLAESVRPCTRCDGYSSGMVKLGGKP